MKAGLPKEAHIKVRQNKRQRSKSKNKLAQLDYESSESEDTKALNHAFELEPQQFVAIGSENY